MKLEKTLHVALNELRMQMLGTQVLFGFQLHSEFPERFADATHEAKLIAGIGAWSCSRACHRPRRISHRLIGGSADRSRPEAARGCGAMRCVERGWRRFRKWQLERVAGIEPARSAWE